MPPVACICRTRRRAAARTSSSHSRHAASAWHTEAFSGWATPGPLDNSISWVLMTEALRAAWDGLLGEKTVGCGWLDCTEPGVRALFWCM